MNNCNNFSEIFIPNFFIISLISAFTFTYFYFILPELISESANNINYYVNFFFTITMYLMWLWCWIVTISGDPGRTIDDLRDRGLLTRILNGDIPNSLRNIPTCPECNLPRPRRAYHCTDCGYCHLRFDHHCIFTGDCIADKNFKAFILSFLYGSILAFSISFSSAIVFFKFRQNHQILSLVLWIYLFFIGVIYFAFGINFYNGGAENLSVADKIKDNGIKNSKSRLWSTFGDKWWKKIIPIQKHTTPFAWPGVNWNDDNVKL